VESEIDKRALVEEAVPMKIQSCVFNMDTGWVELKYPDGTMLSIDCTAVENEVSDNMRQRSELDWLVYNDPVGYAELVLGGDVESYLKDVSSPYSSIGWNE